MSRRLSLTTAAVALILSSMALGQAPRGQELLVYFGTYTNTSSKGIYVSRMNSETGELSAPVLAAETTSPSYLALHPSRDFLYAVNEISTFEGKPTGSVSAFAIDRSTGTLKPLNRQPSMGSGPAHLSTDREGRHVLVANYGGGSVAVLPVADDGSLKPASDVEQHTGSSVDPKRQKEPHAHQIVLDSAGQIAYVPDLGLDKVMIYRFDASKGTLEPAPSAFAAVKPGDGPRHIAFHPNGRYAYVINEISSTIQAFARAADGALEERMRVSSLPPDQKPLPDYSTADIQVHPSGRFLYGSNRGHDSIAVYTIDQTNGSLTFVEAEPTGGKAPRAFGIDPSGRFLLAANQRSDSVGVFRIDEKTGALTPTGTSIQVGAPVCVKFLAPR